MDLKTLDNITYSGNRCIKVSGDALVALRSPMLDYNLLSDLLSYFSGLIFSSVHALIAVHTVTKQENESFSLFKLPDFYTAGIFNSPQYTVQFQSKRKSFDQIIFDYLRKEPILS